MDTKMRSNLYISVDPEEEIVISGIAGRFPNSHNLKEFKENLLNKMDLGTSNHERWSKVFQMPERIGKVNNLEKFDPEFFNISNTEADLMDSMARIMLEHTYEAIIDAGVNPKELQGTKTSVFLGCCVAESHAEYFYKKPWLAGLPMTGTSKSFMTTRISYWLNVTGPSYNIDTACSSSQYAMIAAYEKIRSGECDAAIVIGANICLHPNVLFQFYKLGVLSFDGYCKPFDKEGFGYMRSDAIVVIYLQKAKNARRVYATFVYGKTNCDGFKEEGITFPSLDKQTMLLKEFYEECKISPAELSYVEAHGTGTVVGDSVEIASIDKALCAKRTSPLLIGSVKSNLGHSEASSSLCQIAKVLLGMEAGIIMPTIHFKYPRDDMVAIHEGRIKIVTEVTKFEGGYIGVNSFGFGGANSHILLKSNPKTKINNSTSNDNLPILVAISGRTEEAIKIILNDIQNQPIDTEYISLLHCIHSDNIENHLYRGYTIIGSKILSNAIIKLERRSYIKKPICFIFFGLGTQWLGMSETMMKFSVFANTIQKCNTALKPYKMCLTKILTNKDKSILDNVINLLVGSVGMQIGIVDFLTSIGIVPDFIIGHSIGELICGYVDKCLTLEETILSAYFIGLAFLESNIIHGSMAAINISYETINNICPSDIQIACYNSNNFIVSGATESINLFLAKLQADNISVKEIFCGHVPFHSSYVEPAKDKLLKYLNQTMPEKKSRSLKWLTTSAHESDISSKLCSAKYYTNYLLSPILLAKAINSVPEDAVMIEISPQNILHCVLKESMTNNLLYTRNNDVEMFLQAIGELYNAGLQPQIANLYPTPIFPVSRGTPMISPLIRWNHSQDYYVMKHKQYTKVNKRVMIMSIDTNDEDFSYMADHVIDGKNLLPATGYLFYIWKMMAMINKQEYLDMPICFENIRFLRATVLFKQKEVTLIFTIQKDGNFEITEEDNVVVTGTVRLPNIIEHEKICCNFLNKFVDDKEEISTKDIYKELRLRGYQYSGAFRSLKSASVTGKNGHISWTDNWVAFMDNMLQMMILGHNSRSLFVPTKIRKFIIDPKYHVQVIENVPIQKRDILVRNYKIFDTIISGGIQIYGATATAISRRKTADAILEENKFVAHCDFDTMLLQDAIRMSIHITLECYNSINIKIMELIEDSDKVMPENINSFHINKILDELPQIRQHIKLVAAHKQFQDIVFPNNISIIEPKKLSRDDNCLMVICFGLLTKSRIELYEKLLSLIMPQGFILTLENLDAVYDYSHLNKYRLRVILEKKTNEKTLILLRKMCDVAEVQQVLHLNNHEFSWVENLKSLMNVQNETNTGMKIILVAQDYTCGLLGLVNCLRKEPGGEMIRSVFIQDEKAPIFSLQEPLYSKQLQLDLPINVLRFGNVWGSYRHFPLPLLEPKLVETAYVSQKVYGDLSTLCWMQGKTPLCNESNDLINVVYSSINFKDIMIATGRLLFDFLTHDVTAISLQTDDKFSIGLEFVGFNSNGQRIMGLCSRKGMTNKIAVDHQILQWIVPDKWTMEDAATVPCVYSTCYEALYIKGKIKKGDKILIHSGTGGIGQAAIYLALYEGCEVFTTVGTAEKRQFIKETFFIPDDHIGNSRDTSFKEMIMQQTKGHGVDIVLNSLAEEKLQASIRCLAERGRFLELGKYDMISDNSLDMTLFSKGISFYIILLDNIFYAKTEKKKILHKMIAEGLENGAIKPLCKKFFERDEVEAAFRYMAVGKHIGKIILKIHKDNEHLNTPILAYPRYYCVESKSYIILGGLGGFGLELADWLIQRGAKNLILTSRNGTSNGYQRSRVKLWQSYNVNVHIFVVNNTKKEEECKSILKFAEKQGPVDAIFNLAVVLNDCVFKNQSLETFENSFVPKAWTTKEMDKLSRIICPQLRHFVVFSSISCGRGNAGQTNYGMANSVMERICEKRMEEGLHGLAIQWGAIGDVGLVADMQEDNKEFAIGGTLQQKIISCLDTLEHFLLQDRPIVSSMIVAEKSSSITGTMNILETVAYIMGLKNLNTVAQNMSLSELGMDSMMAVEIKQTLEREFDVILTAQDLRILNFAKLKQMTDAVETKNIKVADEINNDINNLHHLEMLMRKVDDIDLISDIIVELPTKKEVVQYEVFLLPGIEGCASAYKSIAPKIKPLATCLQHGVFNIPGQTRSAINSASHLLPYILEKMKDRKEFLIVAHSFGALIAIELTRLLEAENFRGRLILIDGAPNQLKSLVTQAFGSISEQELENLLLAQLMEMNYTVDKKLLLLDLVKQSTWEEKLNICLAQFPKETDILITDKLKLLSTTIYDHIIAIQNYEDLSLLPRLKSSIILFKPTFGFAFVTDEEDYGLHKVTKGEVQILYVEGTHTTIVNSDKIVSAINGELIEG